MSRKFFLYLFLMAVDGSAVAQRPAQVSCALLAQDALADENRTSMSAEPPVRELCFPRYEGCVERGGWPAELIWRNGFDAEDVRNRLLEYEDWTGRISEANMPGEHGKLVRIERTVGTAHCVRDTYLLYRDNRYRLIDSPSLDALSAEATNCGDAKVELRDMGEPVVVTRFYGVVTAYRFAEYFQLAKICSVRFRAPRP